MGIDAHSITIVGCGPGAADYVTPIARSIVREAGVIAGSQKLIDLFPESRAAHIPLSASIENFLDEIEMVRRERDIVVLTTGDPGFMSIAKPVIKRFGRNVCRIIPGISSLQTAFSRLGLDWFDVLVIDAHSGPPDENYKAIESASKIAVFTGKQDSLKWAASLAHKFGDLFRVFICSDLTLGTERVREIEAQTLACEDHPLLSIVIFVRKEVYHENR